MITSPLPQVRRLLSLFIPLGLAFVATNAAQAASLNLASIQQLTPRLELKSQLLERRFQIVLSRHALALRRAEARCEAGESSACRLAKWQAFLRDVSSASLSDQLYQVNAYVNQVRYRSDQRNWQRADFWAGPEQFFDRGGDCEDYAIAKYVALRAIGVPAEQLRIVVVYDRKTLADHALLAIAAPDGVKVLDSNHKRVIDWEESNRRYSPYYALNEQGVWIYNSKT